MSQMMYVLSVLFCGISVSSFSADIVIPENSTEVSHDARHGSWEKIRHYYLYPDGIQEFNIRVKWVIRKGPREGEPKIPLPRLTWKEPFVFYDFVIENYSDGPYIVEGIKVYYCVRSAFQSDGGDYGQQYEPMEWIGANLIPPAKNGKPGMIVLPLAFGRLARENLALQSLYEHISLASPKSRKLCGMWCFSGALAGNRHSSFVENVVIKEKEKKLAALEDENRKAKTDTPAQPRK